MKADWVFHSGRIFDGRTLHPTATAVAVKDGRIAAVGTDQQVRAVAGGAGETVDLRGRLLTPGFTDAHVHAAMGGVERLGCDLTEAPGAEAALQRVRAYAAARPEKEWVAGCGWYMHHYPGGTPTASLLDTAVADRPVYLINRDHHGAWVNTRALEAAGITAATPDPADGRIERDAAGNPTGTLHEGAMDLVSAHIPPAGQAELDAGLRESQRYLHSLGVTGWQEAILGGYSGHADASTTYRRLYAAGAMTARATGALWVPRTVTLDTVAELVEEFRERRRLNAEAGFATTNAKIMVDGVPENGTAAMLEPYERACDCGTAPNTGLAYLRREVLLAVAAALDAAGFDLHMHTIGDRAVRDGLDAVAHALRANNGSRGPDRRHHLAHIQVIHPEDVPRFGPLGVAANAQALWACNDQQMTELTVPVLGSERAGWQYPFRSLAAGGARLIMGSDWPVSTPDPWQAIHVAVNRREPESPGAEPLVAAEALPLEAALAAYTSGSAWQNRLDGGVLAAGTPADLAVASCDPFGLPALQLHTVSTDLTMVAGQPVHDSATTPQRNTHTA